MTDTTEDKYWFVESDLTEVPLPSRQAAEKAVKFCKQYLGLPAIEVIWFRKVSDWERGFAKIDRSLSRARWERSTSFDSDTDMVGYVGSLTDGIIWVSLELPTEEVIKTVAHEARHLWQLQRFRPPLTLQEKEITENDATVFEWIAWRALK